MNERNRLSDINVKRLEGAYQFVAEDQSPHYEGFKASERINRASLVLREVADGLIQNVSRMCPMEALAKISDEDILLAYKLIVATENTIYRLRNDSVTREKGEGITPRMRDEISVALEALERAGEIFSEEHRYKG